MQLTLVSASQQLFVIHSHGCLNKVEVIIWNWSLYLRWCACVAVRLVVGVTIVSHVYKPNYANCQCRQYQHTKNNPTENKKKQKIVNKSIIHITYHSAIHDEVPPSVDARTIVLLNIDVVWESFEVVREDGSRSVVVRKATGVLHGGRFKHASICWVGSHLLTKSITLMITTTIAAKKKYSVELSVAKTT